ncbi:hypothetical protein, partial [Rodentibacter ratti]|uniref:hypothetical protein n=1 Tax=Rodentibacter ratti TaxID=1906745 RepID=UPI00117A9B69
MTTNIIIPISIILMLIAAIIFSFTSNNNFNEIIELRFDKFDETSGPIYCLDYKNQIYRFSKNDIKNFKIETITKEKVFTGTSTVQTLKIIFFTFIFNNVKFKIKDFPERKMVIFN